MCLFREVLSKPIQFPGAYKQLHHLSVPKRVPEVIKWLNVHQKDMISLKLMSSPCKFKLHLTKKIWSLLLSYQKFPLCFKDTNDII